MNRILAALLLTGALVLPTLSGCHPKEDLMRKANPTPTPTLCPAPQRPTNMVERNFDTLFGVSVCTATPTPTPSATPTPSPTPTPTATPTPAPAIQLVDSMTTQGITSSGTTNTITANNWYTGTPLVNGNQLVAIVTVMSGNISGGLNIAVSSCTTPTGYTLVSSSANGNYTHMFVFYKVVSTTTDYGAFTMTCTDASAEQNSYVTEVVEFSGTSIGTTAIQTAYNTTLGSTMTNTLTPTLLGSNFITAYADYGEPSSLVFSGTLGSYLSSGNVVDQGIENSVVGSLYDYSEFGFSTNAATSNVSGTTIVTTSTESGAQFHPIFGTIIIPPAYVGFVPTPSPSPSPTAHPTASPGPTANPTSTPIVATPTPTVAPTAAPTSTPNASGPFSAPNNYPPYNFTYGAACPGDVWNCPFTQSGFAAVQASNNSSLLSYYNGLNSSGGPNYFSQTNFGYVNQSNDWNDAPIYFSSSSDPSYTVSASDNSPYGYPAVSGSYHIPKGALPENFTSSQTTCNHSIYQDCHIAIIDQTFSPWKELDLWGADKTSGSGGVVTSLTAGVSNYNGDGLNLYTVAGGSAITAGPIKATELIAGNIPHALFVVAPCVSNTSQYPSISRTADTLCSSGVNYGQRMRLNMTQAQILALGLPTYKYAIAIAASTYGMYVMDTNGNNNWSFQFENDNMYTSMGYSNPNCPTNSAPCTPLTAFFNVNYPSTWQGNYYAIDMSVLPWSTYLQFLNSPTTQP
jgi:hypothetical protein